MKQNQLVGLQRPTTANAGSTAAWGPRISAVPYERQLKSEIHWYLPMTFRVFGSPSEFSVPLPLVMAYCNCLRHRSALLRAMLQLGALLPQEQKPSISVYFCCHWTQKMNVHEQFILGMVTLIHCQWCMAWHVRRNASRAVCRSWRRVSSWIGWRFLGLWPVGAVDIEKISHRDSWLLGSCLNKKTKAKGEAGPFFRQCCKEAATVFSPTARLCYGVFGPD